MRPPAAVVTRLGRWSAGAVVLLTACGTQLPHARVLAANGPAPVYARGSSRAPQAPRSDAPTGAAVDVTITASSSLGGGSASSPAAQLATPTTEAPTAANPLAAATAGPAAAGSGGVGSDVITAACRGSSTGLVKLGNIGPYSATGLSGISGARQVLGVWAAYVNAHGGICGRQVQVIIRDDGGSAAQTAAEVRDLVENEHVVAFIGMITIFSVAAEQDYLESHQIPVIGGDVATGVWNRSDIYFPQAASSTEDLYALFRAAQRLPNGTNVAFLYCAEIAACANTYTFMANNHVPETVGSHFVYTKQVSITQISFAAECQAAQKAGAGVVLTAGDASFIGRVANSCGQQGIKLGYLIPGAAATNDLLSNSYLDDAAVTATIVQPWVATDTPGAQLYQQLIREYGVANNGATITAFVSALLAQQTLTLLGSAAATPQDLLDVLHTRITGFTAGGLTGPITFHPGAQDQGQCTGAAIISHGQWVAVNGGVLTCRRGAAGPLPTP
jgi:ABC-type branched-subunit amino acid transport system substrate-binding protein